MGYRWSTISVAFMLLEGESDGETKWFEPPPNSLKLTFQLLRDSFTELLVRKCLFLCCVLRNVTPRNGCTFFADSVCCLPLLQIAAGKYSEVIQFLRPRGELAPNVGMNGGTFNMCLMLNQFSLERFILSSDGVTWHNKIMLMPLTVTRG